MRNIQEKRLELLERSMTGTWTKEDTARTEKDLEDFNGLAIAGEYFRNSHMRKFKCCICGAEFWDYTGCNPDPVIVDENAVCCHRCDWLFVLPARIGVEPGSIPLKIYC